MKKLHKNLDITFFKKVLTFFEICFIIRTQNQFGRYVQYEEEKAHGTIRKRC
ncbi:MAG: hypothetical protein XD76_0119 [candidate division TA06 bacterium 32_111]|uniref:Uncharacterized protein n=1 Tax=candidate division TA06 bacterium 34_109 TaxID=1635277 RepID=A0A101I505_UNCT6|nr:MAG: hypothetical protein XD76_0119 [candidate division TA06 bacterium 32_111]KUK88065.1 MAG: hypothetical protein XE03_0071 [candidate division TA06 bacterium 34_109]